jgi:hypothetical protein
MAIQKKSLKNETGKSTAKRRQAVTRADQPEMRLTKRLSLKTYPPNPC